MTSGQGLGSEPGASSQQSMGPWEGHSPLLASVFLSNEVRERKASTLGHCKHYRGEDWFRGGQRLQACPCWESLKASTSEVGADTHPFSWICSWVCPGAISDHPQGWGPPDNRVSTEEAEKEMRQRKMLGRSAHPWRPPKNAIFC